MGKQIPYSVEVGDLVGGLYLYKLTIGDKIKTGSVVKVD